MAVLLWGKPKFTVEAVGGTVADQSANLTIPDIVKGSLSLSTEQGEEHKAEIEGGGSEAIKNDRNTFTLEFSVRFANGRTMPFIDKSTDGVVTGTYSVKVEANDETTTYLKINEASVRYEDELDADDGARRHYYMKSLVPASGNQIDWNIPS